MAQALSTNHSATLPNQSKDTSLAMSTLQMPAAAKKGQVITLIDNSSSINFACVNNGDESTMKYTLYPFNIVTNSMRNIMEQKLKSEVTINQVAHY
jgi:hypothetical protein